jgi:hypothetical protein
MIIQRAARRQFLPVICETSRTAPFAALVVIAA